MQEICLRFEQALIFLISTLTLQALNDILYVHNKWRIKVIEICLPLASQVDYSGCCNVDQTLKDAIGTTFPEKIKKSGSIVIN